MRAPPLARLIGLACLMAGGAVPAVAATQTAQVKASVVKPLTLSSMQDLDLGSIVLGPGTWAGATVGISEASVFSCTNGNITCTGATRPARYKATGSNNQVARITVPNVTLVNQNDPTQSLILTVDCPATVTFPNSGNQGVTFAIGGAITVDSTTPGGLYSGTFNVTVDY